MVRSASMRASFSKYSASTPPQAPFTMPDNTAPKTASPQQQPRQPQQHAGHRLIIVSLFLRETVQFHPIDQQQQQQQQQQSQQAQPQQAQTQEQPQPEVAYNEPSAVSTDEEPPAAAKPSISIEHQDSQLQAQQKVATPIATNDDPSPTAGTTAPGSESAPAQLTGRRGSHPFSQPPITPHHPHADPDSQIADLLIADPAVQQQAQLKLHEELTLHSVRTQPAPPSPPEYLGNPGDGPYVPSQNNVTVNPATSGANNNQDTLPIHELPARLHSFTLAHPPHSHHHSHSQPHSSSSQSTSASRRASSTSQAFKAGFFAHSLDGANAGNSRSSSMGTATGPDFVIKSPPGHHHHYASSVGSAGSAGTGTGTNSAGNSGFAPLSIINDLANKQQAKQAAAAAVGAVATSQPATNSQTLGVVSSAGGGGSGTGTGTGTTPALHTPSLLQSEARHNPFASALGNAVGLASGAITPRRTAGGGSTTPGGIPNRLGALTAMSSVRSPALAAGVGAGVAMSTSSSGAGSASSAPPISNPGVGLSALPLSPIPSTPQTSTSNRGVVEFSLPGSTPAAPKSFFQQTLSRPPAVLSNLNIKKEGGPPTSAGGSSTQGTTLSSLTAPSSPGLGTPSVGGSHVAPGSVAGQHRKAAGASLLGRSASSGPACGGGGGAGPASQATLIGTGATAGKSQPSGGGLKVESEHPQTYGIVHDHGRAAPAGLAATTGGPGSGGDSGRIRPEHVFSSLPPAVISAGGTTAPSSSSSKSAPPADGGAALAGLGISTQKKKKKEEEGQVGLKINTQAAGPGRSRDSGQSETSSLSASLAAVTLGNSGDHRGSGSSGSSSNSATPATSRTPSSTSTRGSVSGASASGSGSTAAAGTRSPVQQSPVTPIQVTPKRIGRERAPSSHMVPSSTSMATSRTSGGSGIRSRSRHKYHRHHQTPLPRRTSSVASVESHQSSGTVTTTTSNAATAAATASGREVSSCTPTSEHPDEESEFERAGHLLGHEEEEEEEEEEGEYLFAFDFVPNPSANGGLFNAVESLGTLGQGRYGAKGRLQKDGSKAGGNATPNAAGTASSSSAAPSSTGVKAGVVGLGLGGGGDRDAVLRRSTNRLFIGTLGISVDGWLGPIQKDLIERRLLDERQAVPVWVDDATFERSYHDFCKALLWPTFHYTLPGERALENQNEAMRSYIDVNRAFADRIAENWREGDIVWINDYHLLLVPQMLRELLGPSATIGLFMHISFPSSEIFRCLSVRETLLRGMLGADLLGFQTHNNCRHFRQTVSRILQLEATPKGIQLDSISGRGGFVTVNAFPIGIDVRSLNLKRREPDVKEWIQRLETRYEGRKIIVGRDKLDWIKGVRQKLLAYELFLEEHPEWVGQVVLIQVALATTEENEEAGQASDVVARINRRWGSLTYQPVVFLHVQDITFSQYLALLTVADAFLASSLREGMALTPHEYIICQEVKHRPLILSEFVGSYSSLRACLGFNPFNTKQASMAIARALSMEEDEMFERWQDLHRTVVTQTAQHWITSFLSRLERAHAEQQFRDTAFIPRLEIAQLVSEWRAAKTRLILLDLEDALVSQTPLSLHKSGFRPSAKLLDRLRSLTADPKNSVYVLSGMGMVNLTALADAVPRLGLIAENGCFVKHCGEGERSWISLVAGFNLQWRAPVKDILAYFTERTPGSWMEDRGASICWVYWNEELGDAGSHEAQWARRQAAEVQNLIYDSLAERFSLRIIPGPASFLCSPKNTSRASAVQHIMQMSAMGGFWNGGNMIVPGQIVDPNSNTFQSSMSGRTGGGGGGGGGGSGIGSPRKSQLDAVLREEAMKTSGRAKSGQSAADLPYKLPSNHWPVPQPSAPRSAAKDRVPMETMGVRNLQGLFGFGPAAAAAQTMQPNAGSFDFVLAIGQDEGLLRYVNGLDLPFAPVTCTTVDLTRSKGSDAGNHLEGVEDVEEALDEIMEFRERDRRWGRPAMTDV
ncbi:hypothetical protein A4X09_0g3786 [Tilletia walkeri]|uniref:Alpha,alpha-trehalose-phosphate synthase (UDP-forming) n=1 Tax=Tilletia walkeri TaxID=117179 RepID=A0A8X7NAR4_9BASI|nr:hypothetical protein A4X09_0g3786 [Tilletia walkeri]